MICFAELDAGFSGKFHRCAEICDKNLSVEGYKSVDAA